MTDVHPAPDAAHSWSEFLIHIATIAIGLLLGYMNEAVLAGRLPTIDDLATESREAQQTQAQPAHP